MESVLIYAIMSNVSMMIEKNLTTCMPRLFVDCCGLKRASCETEKIDGIVVELPVDVANVDENNSPSMK